MTQEDIAQQYSNASNLNVRIQLHQRFSRNNYGWFRWVFDQINLPSHARILELGSGAGNLWLENLQRIPDGWEITLSDFSAGMLTQVQQNLQGRRQFHFRMIDANLMPLPLEGESFDAVIANHMLYYISEKDSLFSEIYRILKPGGRFYATTVGEQHLVELDELIRRYDPGYIPLKLATDSFALENGAAQLSPWFAQVDSLCYEDSLEVTEATPLVEYILSGWRDLGGESPQSINEYLEHEMARRGGVFHITKVSGIFTAMRE
jgi:ubiquinone/menaquinone biosynthesis C-methylase UbiE